MRRMLVLAISHASVKAVSKSKEKKGAWRVSHAQPIYPAWCELKTNEPGASTANRPSTAYLFMPACLVAVEESAVSTVRVVQRSDPNDGRRGRPRLPAAVFARLAETAQAKWFQGSNEQVNSTTQGTAL